VESSSEHGNVSSGCVSAWLMEQQLPVYFEIDFCDYESCSEVNL